MARPRPELNFHLHDRQGLALTTQATEVLYGGAAGGGKSHLIRIALILWCVAIPGLQAYLFRRQRNDLIKNHVEGLKGFRGLLQPLVESGYVQIVKDEIRFWNGARIYLCHCKDPGDEWGYQGAEMHVLCIDEITHFTEEQYTFLRSRVRAPGLSANIPPEITAQFPKVLCSGNPGYIGHEWVKRTWIDPRAPMEIERVSDEQGGMLRQYIPARLEDNPSMDEDDPLYRVRLRGMFSPELARAMELGDWDIAVGAFFANAWSRDRLVIPTMPIPEHWLKFQSFDWGSARPFSVGWWAVSPGEALTSMDSGQIYIQRGALVKYRQWYGANPKRANCGLEMRNEDIAAGILAREGAGEKVAYRVAGHDIFIERGGPPIAQTFSRCGVVFQKADNNRKAGWKAMYDRMLGMDGQPMLYYMDCCVDSIRVVPVLPRDEKDPEDIIDDSVIEDHAAEEDRYAAMSRPWVRPIPEAQPERDPDKPILNDLLKETFRRANRRGQARV